MTDIFISYSRNDQVWVAKLAKALEGVGYSVWWDTQLLAGDDFHRTIPAVLEEARCVVVVWSKVSVERDWVRAEAYRANERKVLVPVRFEEVRSPLPFNIIHTEDMASWDGNADTPSFQRLLQSVARYCPVLISGRYIDHGNGTVTDTQTKLMWKKCSEGQSCAGCSEGAAQRYNWYDAMEKFAKGVMFAGYNDWRMPTSEELRSLVDNSQSPTINLQAFPNTLSESYWSSSFNDNNAANAFNINFSVGKQWEQFKYYYSFHVRLVRSIP